MADILWAPMLMLSCKSIGEQDGYLLKGGGGCGSRKGGMQCIRSKPDLGCGWFMWFVCVYHCFQRPCPRPQMVHAPQTLVLVVAQQACGLYVSTFDKTSGICV